MSTARVDFTRGAAERIANAVRIIEQGDRTQSGPTFGAATESAAKVFRVARFSGEWFVSQSKTVTFFNQTTTPNTVVAVNLFGKITPVNTSTSVTYRCAIARERTAWYLIAAECG